MFFGFVVSSSGHRFFLVLLPVWGFFYGVGLGAHSVQALFGDAFLATITSWVAGFIIGALFAVLSNLFYFFGVALIAASLGYAAGVSLVLAIALDFGFVAWLVGVLAAVVFAIGAIALNIQKWVVIVATSLLGAGIIVGTFLFMFGGLPPATLVQNPVRLVLQTSPGWLFIFFIMAGFGIVAQYATTRTWDVKVYDRLADLTVCEPAGVANQ
jgi:hypothetical protein